jgi:hypothetical protein
MFKIVENTSGCLTEADVDKLRLLQRPAFGRALPTILKLRITKQLQNSGGQTTAFD